MKHEDRNDEREAANCIAARYAGKARAVMRRAAVSSMADSETPPALESDFCPQCEWVRLMNPEGKGYCKEHGDIEPSK